MDKHQRIYHVGGIVNKKVETIISLVDELSMFEFEGFFDCCIRKYGSFGVLAAKAEAWENQH